MKPDKHNSEAVIKPWRGKVFVSLIVAIGALVIAIALGSVSVPPGEVVRIIAYRALGVGDIADISRTHVSIVWNSRLPRTLLAFIVGAALSVSGAVMQSVLRNPLASSYTLGVSSGASLGAALVIFTGLPIFLNFSLPFMGFVFGMGTIVLAIMFATRIDGQMENNTIILVGMVFSLFLNSVTSLLMALQREHMTQLIVWQMGSFAMREWLTVWILLPVTVTGVLFVLRYNRELDIMTFGEEQARLMGVNLRQVKWILLMISAALTGSAIAFVGIIGFVDLVAPHVVRRIFGAGHRVVIPMSALFGGVFMVMCDLIARTVVTPSELPVGVVSALIGAPFFAYVYFSRRR